MKIKSFAVSVLFSMMFGLVSFAAAMPKPAPKTSDLLAMLPASDMVMTLDTKRLFDEALPQMLSTNKPMLEQLFAGLADVREKTGVDIRSFNDVAVGIATRRIDEKSFGFEPMILARGKYSPDALIAIAKLAAGDGYREEKIGDRTVYIFSAEKMVKEAKTKTGSSVMAGIFDGILEGLSREMAVTSVDESTIAIGSMFQMRAMFEAKTKLGGEISYLVSRKAGSIMSFGGVMPDGLSSLIDFDNDALGDSLDSIRKIAAAMDVADGQTTVWVSAKTADAAKAKDLKMTLDDLQSIGKLALTRVRGDDKRVYQRMIENAKITLTGTEISLDIKVPQADLDVLVAQLK